jgi:hypothetical protein
LVRRRSSSVSDQGSSHPLLPHDSEAL